GKPGEAGAVEIDPAMVDVIRVLIRIEAADPKCDLILLWIEMIHATNEPFALRNGRGLFRLRVDPVNMIPAAAFAHPDEFAAFGQESQESLVRIIEERFAFFIDKSFDLARFAIDGDDTHDLMAALVVKEAELFRIGGPLAISDRPR